ncbi:MAG TPA: hypothetical protein VKR42_07275 [Ktedonobacteraceae bacterium]|nr:hypothetical protein [Ktedonobacteraceae bacterium]
MMLSQVSSTPYLGTLLTPADWHIATARALGAINRPLRATGAGHVPHPWRVG